RGYQRRVFQNSDAITLKTIFLDKRTGFDVCAWAFCFISSVYPMQSKMMAFKGSLSNSDIAVLKCSSSMTYGELNRLVAKNPAALHFSLISCDWLGSGMTTPMLPC